MAQTPTIGNNGLATATHSLYSLIDDLIFLPWYFHLEVERIITNMHLHNTYTC